MSEAAPSSGTRSLSPFEWACLGVVALAFLVRVHAVLHPNFIWDSAWYLMLARSFGEHGNFLLPWFDRPVYSGYWPPLYPILVSPLVKLLGPSYSTLALASVLMTALLVLAVFLTTRDLFGRTRAFAAMALVAANPAWLASDSHGMSESTLALMVTLAVWAFIKSLDRPLWLPVAGAFAMLAYLGKATLGLPIVAVMVAALAGWRVQTRGVARVLRSPMDLAMAGIALVGLVLVGITRSGKLGGVGVGIIEPIRRAISEPMWAPTFAFKIVFAAAFLLVVTLPFSLHLRGALRARRTEATDALWLATLLPLVAGAVFTTSFYFTERRPLVDFDNIRYLTPAIVPFLWLTLPHWPAERDLEAPPRAERSDLARSHRTWLSLAAGTYVLLLFFSPFAGVPTLGRVRTFLLLALVPLAFAAIARATHYTVAERRQVNGERVMRYASAKATGPHVPALAAAAAVAAFVLLPLVGYAERFFQAVFLLAVAVLVARLVMRQVRARREGAAMSEADWSAPALVALAGFALAYYVSAWYAAVFLGLAIASSAMTHRARAVVMALVLLAATAPEFHTPFPAETVAAEIQALVPEGEVIGVTDPVVYFAAVAPEDLTLRISNMPPPEGIDYALMTVSSAGESYEGWTMVRSWDYTFVFFPTLEWRLHLEEGLLGKPFVTRSGEGMSLWVRDNATAAPSEA